MRERGWINADDLERLTGERRQPDVENWVVDPGVLHRALEEIRSAVDDAGPMGLNLAGLDPFRRAAADLLDDLVVEAGRLMPTKAVDPLTDHPFLATLAASPFAPPPPDGIERSELRELVRRGDVVETEGIFYAAEAIEAAGRLAARLLAASVRAEELVERGALRAARRVELEHLEEAVVAARRIHRVNVSGGGRQHPQAYHAPTYPSGRNRRDPKTWRCSYSRPQASEILICNPGRLPNQ